MRKIIASLVIIFMINSATFAGVNCWWEFNDTQNPTRSTLEAGSAVAINNVVKVGTIPYGMQEGAEEVTLPQGVAATSSASIWLHRPQYTIYGHKPGSGGSIWHSGTVPLNGVAVRYQSNSSGNLYITSSSEAHYAHHYCTTDGGSSGPVGAVNFIIKAK